MFFHPPVDVDNSASNASNASSIPAVPDQTIDGMTAMLPQYKRCLCLGIQAGRACPICSSTKWLKRCQDCAGSGLLDRSTRVGGAPRTDRCGFCLGRGWVGAKPADRGAIHEQETGVVAVRQQAERKLASVLEPPRQRRTAAAKKSVKSAKPAQKRKGRQPSAKSMAILAERTGQPVASSASVASDLGRQIAVAVSE